jgi:excisionase family DNA binding protein
MNETARSRSMLAQACWLVPLAFALQVLFELLLTVREAAEQLRISRTSLYKLCAQNQVAHVGVGNAIRFAPADFARVRARRSCV